MVKIILLICFMFVAFGFGIGFLLSGVINKHR